MSNCSKSGMFFLQTNEEPTEKSMLRFFKYIDSCSIPALKQLWTFISLSKIAGESSLAETLIGYCICRAHLTSIKQSLQKEELSKVKLKSFTTLTGSA